MTEQQTLLLRYLADARFNNSDMRGEEREAVAAALAELDALRAAGDTLNGLVRSMRNYLVNAGFPEDDPLRLEVSAALAGWAAARGQAEPKGTEQCHANDSRA